MRKTIATAALVCAALALTACAAKQPAQSQLQVREFQTRNYDDTDVKLAMKAMMNVL